MEESLSKYGYWAKGYWEARVDTLEDILDMIEDTKEPVDANEVKQ